MLLNNSSLYTRMRRAGTPLGRGLVRGSRMCAANAYW